MSKIVDFKRSRRTDVEDGKARVLINPAKQSCSVISWDFFGRLLIKIDRGDDGHFMAICDNKGVIKQILKLYCQVTPTEIHPCFFPVRVESFKKLVLLYQ